MSDGGILDRRVEDVARPMLEDLESRIREQQARVPSDVRKALEPRYVIEGKLGAGGMAIVYLALDTVMKRHVAIKVLRPELVDGLTKDRFEREIAVVAHLDHPRIVPVYDRGAATGVLYYVMRFVRGESLRDRLEARKQLEIRDTIDVSRQVAEALDHAHGHGVVHRDIKPENILLDGNGAYLADFGAARIQLAAGVDQITRTGMAIGTAPYMSPEQIEASPSIDGRSDVYSLACVLYEMLAGEPPYTGRNLRDVLAKHMAAAIPNLCVVRNTVTPPMQEVLVKGLAKSAADRFTGARQLVEALERAFMQPAATSTSSKPPRRRTVAVLPFANMSGDSANDYFGEGLAEDLISNLIRAGTLRVVARTSSFAFKGQNRDVREIGSALGATHVLEGSVRIARGRLRASAQLVDAGTGHPLWSERFDCGLEDVFEVQDTITNAIAERLSYWYDTTRKRQLERVKAARAATRQTGSFVAMVDNELFENMTPEQLELVADHAWRRRRRMEKEDAKDEVEDEKRHPRDVLVQVRIKDPDGSRLEVQTILDEFVRKWAIAGVERETDGTHVVEYMAQLKKGSLSSDLAAALIARPQVLGAEVRIGGRPTGSSLVFADNEEFENLSAEQLELSADERVEPVVSRTYRGKATLPESSRSSSAWRDLVEWFAKVFLRRRWVTFEGGARSERAPELAAALQSTQEPESKFLPYDAYLRGRFLLTYESRPQSLVEAIGEFDRAIEGNSSYAPAYAARALARIMLARTGVATAADLRARAERDVALALAYDPELAEAHVASALVAIFFHWNRQAALQALDTAIETSPAFAGAYLWLGFALNWLERAPDAAVDSLYRAIDLDPLTLAGRVELTFARLFAGNLEQALIDANDTVTSGRRLGSEAGGDDDHVSEAEGFADAHYVRAIVLTQLGRYATAIADAEEACRVGGRQTMHLAALGYVQALNGDVPRARAIVAELEARGREGAAVWTALATVHVALQEDDAVLSALKEAMDAREVNFVFVSASPHFSRIRSDSRFVRLIESAGLSVTQTTA